MTTTNTTSTPNYGFVIDNRRCIGCHACTVACKSEHDDPISVNKTWVSYIEKGVYPDTTRQFHVMRCNHCAEAPCVEICPTACLTTRDDGIVDFDPGRCIGCKACMQACPYDAITINPMSGTATKCNYCAHRVEEGREPACVVVCPAEAIIPGDLNNPSSKIANLVASQDVSVRKPEKGTLPKLYYVEGDAAALQPAASIRTSETLWGYKDTDIVDDTPVAEQIQSTAAGAPRRAYDIAQRHAGSWGWKVSAYLFTKSIAAGAFLTPVLAALSGVPLPGTLLIGVIVALIALAATGVLLVADLKRPERFLWVLLRPQWKSWLVRGAYIIAGYSLVLLIMLILALRKEPVGPWGVWLQVAGCVLAAGTASYSGWLFGQAKGRDLWQSPLVPLHLLVQAMVVGMAIYLPLVAVDGAAHWYPKVFATLLAIDFVLIAQDVWGRHQTADASRAAKMMRSGQWGSLLIGGALVVGHLVPLLLCFTDGGASRALAALCACAGVAIYEHLWVAAPQRVALA